MAHYKVTAILVHRIPHEIFVEAKSKLDAESIIEEWIESGEWQEGMQTAEIIPEHDERQCEILSTERI